MWMATARIRIAFIGIVILLPLRGQDPYAFLKNKDYAHALSAFEASLQANPEKINLRKDYAYTLLKVGESELARDQFAEIEKSTPTDWQAGLEYAFLCHETRQPAIARRVFDRVRNDAPEPFRTTAEKAFQNIDKPLVDGITRWKRAVESGPNTFSNHEELAHLAEQTGRTGARRAALSVRLEAQE